MLVFVIICQQFIAECLFWMIKGVKSKMKKVQLRRLTEDADAN